MMATTQANMAMRMGEDPPRVRDGAALAREEARSAKWDILTSEIKIAALGPGLAVIGRAVF